MATKPMGGGAGGPKGLLAGPLRKELFFAVSLGNKHSLSSNSCSVKTACLRIVCGCMNRNLPWSGSRAQEYIVRHSNIVLSFFSQRSHD